MAEREHKKRVPFEDVYAIFDVSYPVLKIPTEKAGDRFPIGLRKARAILEHLEAIRAFVAKHDRAGCAVADEPEPGEISQ